MYKKIGIFRRIPIGKRLHTMYFKITSFDPMETNSEEKQSFNAKCMFDLRLKAIPCK